MDSPFEIKTLLIFILFSSFGQTLFASILLLMTKNGDRIANLFLAGFMLGLNLCFALIYVRGYWISQYAHTAYIYIPIMFILPILLWLYVKRLTHPESKTSFLKLTLHFVPATNAILLLTPFYLLPSIEKLEWMFVRAHPYFEMSTVQQWTTSVMPLIHYFAVFAALAYMAVSTKLLVQHKKIISEQFSYSENINLAWLQYLIGICGLVSILHFLRLIFFPPYILDAPYEVTSIIIIAVSLSVFAYFGVNQKTIFRYSSELDALSSSPKTASGEKELPQVEKYKSSTLTATKMQLIKKQLCDQMLNNELFLDSELTIKEVALTLDCSPRDLSRVINEQLEMTFLEFVNSYRVEYAKKTLIKKTRMTILDIAMAVGFNSKSTFYSAFKKYTGTSPTEFKNEYC
jgi:AraC-like DNA-binding protein